MIAFASISVVVCSAQRPELLAGCMWALASHPGWHDGDEVVVVLNGADRVSSLWALDDWTRRDAPVPLRVEELVPAGLSAARNRAAEVARGDVLLFLDDDARPRPGWLTAWRRAFDAPHFDFGGGPIELEWPSDPPRWFTPGLAKYWSALDVEPDDEVWPYGANMAMRRSTLASMGGFDERLGLGVADAPRGGEADLRIRFHRAGRSIGWVGDARVSHLVTAPRARLRWLLSRAVEQGLADRAIGAAAPRSWQPVTTGWHSLARTLAAEPSHWRQTVAIDLTRRARLVGRVRGRAVAARPDGSRLTPNTASSADRGQAPAARLMAPSRRNRLSS